MLFNSYSFIFIFLPLAVAGYWLAARCGGKWPRIFLLLASVVFYAFAGWPFLAYLAASVCVGGALAYAVERADGRARRGWLALSVAASVGALAVAKYSGFFIVNVNRIFGTDWQLLRIVVPLGISFFTFSQIAYVIGVYRRELPRMSFGDYALYVFYFPKLLMGPITEPRAFFAQLDSAHRIDWSEMCSGLQLFFFGLFKKVFFADAFARTVAYGFGVTDPLSSLDVVIVALAYTFEIYFDFSGYTDMAIGVSRMFGIELPINFDSPYRALSVRDFWKRWHLTLTGFLTKYVYFPLGGSRRGTGRTYANIIVVFLVSGLWHGANWTFVVWGLLHGLLMVRDRMMEKFDAKIPKLIRWAVMFAVTNLLWLLFRSADFAQFKSMMTALFSFRLTLDPVLTHSVVDPLALPWLLLAAFVVCVALPNSTRRAFRTDVWNLLLTVAAAVYGIFSLGGNSTFVYFNF